MSDALKAVIANRPSDDILKAAQELGVERNPQCTQCNDENSCLIRRCIEKSFANYRAQRAVQAEVASFREPTMRRIP